MPEGIELRDYACPQCGARARLDARFIQWCTSCGHNADPKPPQPGKREQRRAERELERSRKLFESLRTAAPSRVVVRTPRFRPADIHSGAPAPASALSGSPQEHRSFHGAQVL
jgi:hypothetical protein